MNFKECKIKGIFLIKPKLINDERGFFSEIYRKKILNDIVGDKINFVNQIFLNPHMEPSEDYIFKFHHTCTI